MHSILHHARMYHLILPKRNTVQLFSGPNPMRKEIDQNFVFKVKVQGRCIRACFINEGKKMRYIEIYVKRKLYIITNFRYTQSAKIL